MVELVITPLLIYALGISCLFLVLLKMYLWLHEDKRDDVKDYERMLEHLRNEIVYYKQMSKRSLDISIGVVSPEKLMAIIYNRYIEGKLDKETSAILDEYKRRTVKNVPR